MVAVIVLYYYYYYYQYYIVSRYSITVDGGSFRNKFSEVLTPWSAPDVSPMVRPHAH